MIKHAVIQNEARQRFVFNNLLLLPQHHLQSRHPTTAPMWYKCFYLSLSSIYESIRLLWRNLERMMTVLLQMFEFLFALLQSHYSAKSTRLIYSKAKKQKKIKMKAAQHSKQRFSPLHKNVPTSNYSIRSQNSTIS